MRPVPSVWAPPPASPPLEGKGRCLKKQGRQGGAFLPGNTGFALKLPRRNILSLSLKLWGTASNLLGSLGSWTCQVTPTFKQHLELERIPPPSSQWAAQSQPLLLEPMAGLEFEAGARTQWSLPWARGTSLWPPRGYKY